MKTSIGTLKYFDGVPTEKTIDTMYDYLDRSRAVEVFLNSIPAMSMYALREEQAIAGCAENNWLQAVPGKSWFIALRMYGPLQPWIDQTWRPGEIELVE